MGGGGGGGQTTCHLSAAYVMSIEAEREYIGNRTGQQDAPGFLDGALAAVPLHEHTLCTV